MELKDEKGYAPIIIPTLCRYEHLKGCIESLARCNLAKKTRLYISLDYPVSEKHVEGWKRISEYLRDGISGFEKVICFYQKENLGALANELFLIKEAYKEYDRYIFTEDDNVFAPAVIEYWNRALDQYEHDENVIAVCAKSFPEYNYEADDNIFMMQSFSAYGYGTWKNKDLELRSKINKELIDKIIRDKKCFHRVYTGNRGVLFGLLSMALEKEQVHFDRKGNLAATDYAITLYMTYYNKYAIYPRRCLTRNNGYDGSGENCEKRTTSAMILDERTTFEIKCKTPLKTEKVLRREKWYQYGSRMLMLIEAVLIRHFGTGWYKYFKKYLHDERR